MFVCFFLVLFCFICMSRVIFWVLFISIDRVLSFLTITLIGMEKTFCYNGLRQIGLISFKWGSSFGVLSVDSKQLISLGSSSVIYGILLLSQGCCRFNQYNLQDKILQLNSDPTLYWGGSLHMLANWLAHTLLLYPFS